MGRFVGTHIYQSNLKAINHHQDYHIKRAKENIDKLQNTWFIFEFIE